jgi:hypothetical protein
MISDLVVLFQVERPRTVVLSSKTGTGKPVAQEQPAASQTAPKPPASQSANEQVREVMEWEKKGLVEGDTTRFKARLRSMDPNIRAEAQQEFEQFKREIRSGQKVDVEDYRRSRGVDDPGHMRMSDANKAELEDSGWLKGEEPDPLRRGKFMEWLEKNHKAGELGPEIPKGAKAVDGHVHVKPGSQYAKEMLKRWREEEGGFPARPGNATETENSLRPEESAATESSAEPRDPQVETGEITGAAEGAEAAGEDAAQSVGRGAAEAMGETAAEGFSEAAVKGLLKGGGRAFLSAVG